MPRVAAALLTMLLIGCGRQSAKPGSQNAGSGAWFADVTEQAGIRFQHDAGALPTPSRYFMPQSIGSGAALIDYDQDGRLDIYLLQNGGPGSHSTNRLFHQGSDGRFTDATRGSGLDIAGYGMGVAVGDVNNDGWPDLLVTEYGALHLFLNQGNGKFVDVTGQAGLNSPLWGTSASFFDYDRDGWLDLVVANYVDYDPARPCAAASGQRDYCSPSQFLGSVPKLYHNLGARTASQAAVRFEDVTLASGLGKVPGSGLGVVCLDFTGDHWPDILFANDGQPNRLWINQHNGSFKEEAVERGIAYNANGQAQANMGIAVADVNRDGLFDVFITHLTEETNTLWQQQPLGLFEDRTATAGLAQLQFRATGFGAVLADFNHDGAPDLAIANGRVSRSKSGGAAGANAFWDQYAERNQLFLNDGRGHFRDISASTPALTGTPGVARGLACGDIDGDGALDLLITGIAGPARLLRNVTPNRGHWLMVRAVDPALRRDAYGAEITVRAGGRSLRGWLNPGYSYLCSNDPRVHFGLGTADRVDGVEVTWPDGALETFGPLAADRLVTLRKGEGHVEQK